MIRKFDRQNDTVLTRQQIRDVDAWAINTLGVPGVVLMENAGRGCTEIIISELKKRGGSKVCIFCGTGNNGGDGFVIARLLTNAGYKVKILLCGPTAKIKGDAQINYKIAVNMQIPITELSLTPEKVNEDVRRLAGDCDLIVDAIFGTGLSGELAGNFAALINAINSINKPVIAVDIPSGLDCDNGESMSTAIKAISTVTFVAAKKGFQNQRSIEYTGAVYIASIGIEPV
ncbi:MAG: NAD(P)H-hydrate epimerase [Planctomycetes bacterium GWF2_41_51]|nr:MAG: NAD(P)H-hydrate epimerase [Planctomycetes bacterium GWF2_41_51]HBG28924.1 NAD(P)H-hydrate epimerase [Phycisphaerales bacterium]